jgi:hypothetical protein
MELLPMLKTSSPLHPRNCKSAKSKQVENKPNPKAVAVRRRIEDLMEQRQINQYFMC